MGEVITLPVEERLVVDAGPIERLVNQFGRYDAEVFVAHRLDDIAEDLHLLGVAYKAADWRDFRRVAERIAVYAEELGFVTLRFATQALVRAAKGADAASIAATYARVDRLGRSCSRELPVDGRRA